MDTQTTQASKICKGCNVITPIDGFTTSNCTLDGRQNLCRPCFKERYKVSIKKAAKKNQENGYAQQFMKDWYLKNKDKHKRNVIDDINRKYKNDPAFRHNANARILVYNARTGKLKGGKVFEQQFGRTPQEYRDTLAPKVDILHGWGLKPELEHLIPLSWFKPMAPVAISFHLDNLDVVPAYKNDEKRNRFACPVPFEFYLQAVEWVKPEYQNSIIYF